MRIDPLSTYIQQTNIQGPKKAPKQADAGNDAAEQVAQPKDHRPVQVSLSSPVAQLYRKAIDLYDQEAAAPSAVRVEAARNLLTHWQGLDNDQVDDLADLLMSDIEGLNTAFLPQE